MEVGVGVFLIAFLAAFQSAASQCTTGSLQLDESVFLSNGTIAAGLLLVCRDGVWGTIQADTSSLFWSEKNAVVACRSLGFNGALNTVPATQIDPDDRPSSAVPVLYSSAACTGVERFITDCPGIVPVQDTVTHTSDVYLVCWPGTLSYNDLHTVVSTTSRFGDVRLVGDAINGRGAVEIFTSSDWTTICPDNTWTDADAAIICQVLGYETGTAKTYQITASNTTTISPLLVRDSQCMARRQTSTIFRIDGGYCSFALVGANPCSIQGYAGVICGATSEDFATRLFGLDSFNSEDFVGIVEYFLDGRWGVLCAPTTRASSTPQVICGELGYPRDRTSYVTSVSVVQIQNVESRQKPAWLLDFSCGSTAKYFSDCNVVRPVGYGRCRRSGDILVVNCGPKKRPLTSGQVAGIVVPSVLLSVGVVLLLVYKDHWVPKLKQSKFYKFLRCECCRDWKAAVARRRARWRAARQQRQPTARNQSAPIPSQPVNVGTPEPEPPATSSQLEDSTPAASELFRTAPPPYAAASEFPECSKGAPPPYSVH